jgi:hypothetical protein
MSRTVRGDVLFVGSRDSRGNDLGNRARIALSLIGASREMPGPTLAFRRVEGHLFFVVGGHHRLPSATHMQGYLDC